jgi:hypothetical protein
MGSQVEQFMSLVKLISNIEVVSEALIASGIIFKSGNLSIDVIK